MVICYSIEVTTFPRAKGLETLNEEMAVDADDLDDEDGTEDAEPTPQKGRSSVTIADLEALLGPLSSEDEDEDTEETEI